MEKGKVLKFGVKQKKAVEPIIKAMIATCENSTVVRYEMGVLYGKSFFRATLNPGMDNESTTLWTDNMPKLKQQVKNLLKAG